MIEIATTTTDLRQQAKELGLKGLSSANKATLIPLITAEVARRNAEELAARKAEAEKAAREAKEAASGVNPASTDANVMAPGESAESPAEEFNRLTALPLSQQTKAIQKRIRQLSNLPENTGPREEVATPVKTGSCRSCGVRNIGTGSGDANDRDAARAVQLCVPCHEEAQWENEHSDRGHDTFPEDAAERAGCWICHPELNRASADYKGRYATSRAGMKMNVTRKMSSREKAELVAQQLTKSKIVQHKDGGVTLTGDSPAGKVELRFTARSFDYKRSTVGGKKVLNVAAALRRIAEAA